MDYTINDAPSLTTARVLLENLGVDIASVKTIWFSLPTAQFITPDHFDDELSVVGNYIRVFNSDSCMADALLNIVQDLRLKTECTCTFGHEGAYQLVTILSDICAKKGQPNDITLMRDLASVMTTQAKCAEGKAIGHTVIQALDFFGSEIEEHITKKTCAAGECQAFKTYHILVSRCTGCGKCLDVCDDDAILGKSKFVHVVVQKNCTQCNKCLEVCPENAVVTAGLVKPKTPPKPIPCKRR